MLIEHSLRALIQSGYNKPLLLDYLALQYLEPRLSGMAIKNVPQIRMRYAAVTMHGDKQAYLLCMRRLPCDMLFIN